MPTEIAPGALLNGIGLVNTQTQQGSYYTSGILQLNVVDPGNAAKRVQADIGLRARPS